MLSTFRVHWTTVLIYFPSSKDGKWLGLQLDVPTRQCNGRSHWAGIHTDPSTTKSLKPRIEVDLPGSRLTDAALSVAAMGFLSRETAASVGLAISAEVKGPFIRVAIVYYYPNKIHL